MCASDDDEYYNGGYDKRSKAGHIDLRKVAANREKRQAAGDNSAAPRKYDTTQIELAKLLYIGGKRFAEIQKLTGIPQAALNYYAFARKGANWKDLKAKIEKAQEQTAVALAGDTVRNYMLALNKVSNDFVKRINDGEELTLQDQRTLSNIVSEQMRGVIALNEKPEVRNQTNVQVNIGHEEAKALMENDPGLLTEGEESAEQSQSADHSGPIRET